MAFQPEDPIHKRTLEEQLKINEQLLRDIKKLLEIMCEIEVENGEIK